MKLTQAEFDVKYAAMRAKLARAYSAELAATVERMGYCSVEHLMDLCATNEPDEPFADGDCSDEAIEFVADSIVGAIS